MGGNAPLVQGAAPAATSGAGGHYQCNHAGQEAPPREE